MGGRLGGGEGERGGCGVCGGGYLRLPLTADVSESDVRESVLPPHSPGKGGGGGEGELVPGTEFFISGNLDREVPGQGPGGRGWASTVCGRWGLGVGVQGVFTGVHMVFRSPSWLPEVQVVHIPNATVTCEGGPWHIEASSIQAARALAVRARLGASLGLDHCFVGGLGPLGDR